MISVGSSDARKGLGLSLGGRVDMEESELEEGEACSYQNNEDFDASIDPDVAFSYIDEKIQVVLGHFQKDFEGGFSAENLGAKYGGYGSFLPAYQRSPAWSRPRTPPKVHIQNMPISPNNVRLEGGQGDSVDYSSATHSFKLGPSSVNSSRPLAAKLPSTGGGINQENCLMPTCAEALTSKYESINKKSTSITDQKTLKVRIKMGTDSLSTQKNAAIYSGLGLDVSPSSSLDDSPSESEEISHGPHDVSFESPTSILQIMSSLPMSLSPLSDDLLQLAGEETCAKDSMPVPVHMDGLERSVMLQLDSNIIKGDAKKLGGKKMKSVDGYGSSIEVKAGFNDSARKDIGILLMKEQVIDSLTTEELVSKTLKLPLLSSSYSSSDESLKDVGGPGDTLKEPNKDIVLEKAFCAEHVEPPKKAFQKGDLCEQDSTALHITEHPFPGGKKKLTGSYQTMAPESNNESSRTDTFMSKAKKRIDDISMSKNETEDSRLKDHGKAKDAYRDFFGDLEDDEDRRDSLETLHEDKPKDSEVVKKSTTAVNSGVKEKSGGKKFDKPLASEAYPPTAKNLVRYSGNGHASTNGNGVPATVPPVVIEENWVQCDKCQKWRLLPLGTNPESLPEKWLCSMLNWLPDMNRCSVSEDETTKALVALFQGPPPEGQRISGSVLMVGTSSAVQYPNQNDLNHGLNAMPGGKKSTVKEISNSESKDGPFQLSSSGKKNSRSSMKSRSISDMSKSPSISESNVRGGKHKNKQKKQDSYSDRGDTKNLKAKSCRDTDQDYSRQSKKRKTDSMHFIDHQWIPDPSGATTKFHHSLRSSSPTTAAGKELPKHKERSSLGDSKYDGKDSLQVSVEKIKDKGWGSLDEESLDSRNPNTIDSVKKRKLKEYQDLDHCHQQESKISVQDVFSRKEKKTRLSKSEGRESSISKVSGKTDKKVSQTKHQKIRKDLGSTLSQQSLDGMDSVKRDSRSVQVSAAATSSSSKVSGSHKTKASFQEVKGSPVESVSSSPLRSLNTEKFTSGELMGKYNSHDIGVIGSPARCLEVEDARGSDRSGATRKDKSFVVAYHGSCGPSVLDFQNKEVNHVSDGKSKAQMLPSPDITTNHFTNGGVDTVDQYRKHSSTKQIKDQCQVEDGNDVYCANNMCNPRKTGQGSSSSLKDNSLSCKFESTAEKVKKTSLFQMQDQPPSSEAKHGDGKLKLQDKLGLKSDRSENIIAAKQDCSRNDSRQKDHQFNRGHDVAYTTLDAICKLEPLSASCQNQLPDCDDERYSKRSLSERTDQEVLGKGKSLLLPPSGGAETETLCHGPQLVVGLHQGNGDMVLDPLKVDNASKLQKKQVRKADHQNGTQPLSSRYSMLNGHRSKELDAPSPIRRESSSHAANNAVKEAKDLKHLADRLKNSGSSHDSAWLYFQAVLKFLHGASLLESGNNDNAKYSEMNQAKQMYSSTAKLCEFCAHEFEKLKNMAAAALAYKCMEVAYMRVIYSSHASAGRDRHELQSALQSVPLGESPSSSASDVDNANNSTAADKIALSKGVSPSQVAGTHVIAAQNRPNLMRLLNFAQDVNFAMEASRKSRIAFAAANSSSCDGKHADGISPIKKALDFNFQDMEGLLRLVRLAMEVINR